MKRTKTVLEHERLRKLILETFQNEAGTLNPELQSILIDDLITAFHNRLTILKKIQSKQ